MWSSHNEINRRIMGTLQTKRFLGADGCGDMLTVDAILSVCRGTETDSTAVNTASVTVV